MPTRIVTVTQGERQTTAIVECERQADDDDDGELRVSRWRIVLKPQLDFAARHVGYRVWVQCDDMQLSCEAEALADACLLIEHVVSASA